MTGTTSAQGLGLPLATHICAGTGLRLSHLCRDWARPMPHLHRDWDRPLCTCQSSASTASDAVVERSGAGLCRQGDQAMIRILV